jgi:hypothetical protein
MQSWSQPGTNTLPSQETVSGNAQAQAPVSLESRVTRLENEVSSLRQDMDRLLPALRRLISGQEEVADIVADMKGRQKTSKPLAKKKTMKPVIRQAEHTVPTSTYQGPPKLADIRTGQHKGFTRLVMDVGSPTPYQVDVDNAEKLLIIELPQAAHDKALSGNVATSPLIKSYQTQAMDGGSRIIAQLQKPVKILKRMSLEPSGRRGARIALDIGAQ